MLHKASQLKGAVVTALLVTAGHTQETYYTLLALGGEAALAKGMNDALPPEMQNPMPTLDPMAIDQAAQAFVAKRKPVFRGS